MHRERKVQGAQWYVTLPKEWRNEDGHNIKKGDTLDAFFNTDSVLIFNPKEREMSPIERNLIGILTGLPQVGNTKERVKELVENLRTLVEQLDETA